jgi:hypothetical protein
LFAFVSLALPLLPYSNLIWVAIEIPFRKNPRN